MVLHPLPPAKKFTPFTTLNQSTTLLVDGGTFFADTNQNFRTFGFTSVLNIPPTPNPKPMTTRVGQFEHLCQNPLEGTI